MFRLQEMTSFLLEMILALAIFTWNKKKRKFFWIIMPVVIVASYFVIRYTTVAINKIEIKLIKLIIKYAFAFIIITFAAWASFDRPFRESFLSVGEAYLMQNLAFYTQSAIRYTAGINWQIWTYYRWGIIIALYAVAFIISIFAKKFKLNNDKSWLYYLLSGIILVVVLILSSFNTTSKNFGVINCIYAIVVDGFVLCLYLGIFRMSAQKQIIDMYERLIRLEKKQTQLSKDSIEIINFKCHDLRHQLTLLRNGKKYSDYNEKIKNIENAISDYEAMSDTGNEVLDIVITEKYLLCLKEEIEFSYMLEGEELFFMEDIDICTLFGNMLENAINSVREAEKEKRFITLSMAKKQKLLCINLENYCAVAPVFINGLPRSVKDDGQFHGYGARSMKNVAEKYDGNLVMSFEDGIFVTDVVIPCRDKN